MNPDPKVILITGATGFLGTALCHYFGERGYLVRALVRDVEKAQSLEAVATGGIFRCDLPHDIDEQAFTGDITALIHCAYASQSTDRRVAEAINIRGSSRLLELSRKYRVDRFVFISSLSAQSEAESFYGQSKLKVEKMLDTTRDLIIRPGLIIGRGGLFQRMHKSIQRLPVVPLFYGGKQAIQIIWIKDLCRAIESALEKDLVGLYNVAGRQGIELTAFYKALANTAGRSCHFVRLPGNISLNILRVCERLGMKLPVSSENLLGLKHMKVFNTSPDLAELGITPLSLDEALERITA